jgi:hypothetical protein
MCNAKKSDAPNAREIANWLELKFCSLASVDGTARKPEVTNAVLLKVPWRLIRPHVNLDQKFQLPRLQKVQLHPTLPIAYP